MKYYLALFKKSVENIEVEFPDLQGCVTFGADWDEAYNNAIDALAGWLANAEPQFIVEPSSYEVFEHYRKHATIVPIPVDESIMESYQKLKRINVIFPSEVLNKVDIYRKKMGLKRSTFLVRACLEFLKKNQKNKKKHYSDHGKKRANAR